MPFSYQKGAVVHLLAELTKDRAGVRLDPDRNKDIIPSRVPAGTAGTIVDLTREEMLIEFVWGQHRASKIWFWFRRSRASDFREF